MHKETIGNATILLGDCVEQMKALEDNSVDSIVTDPPAGIAFMGKAWDKDKGGRDQWIAWMTEVATECLRVIKPGGHALVWALPRTSHWTATAWEDAGFVIRERIAHCFGNGFPKSMNVGKSSGLKELEGWGTALKPAIEDWWLFRKPLIGTVAENILTHGVGGLNIDACRVPINPDVDDHRLGGKGTWDTKNAAKNVYEGGYAGDVVGSSEKGRFPPHLILDGSDEVNALFPETASGKPCGIKKASNNVYGQYGTGIEITGFGDAGSASRLFPKLGYSDHDIDVTPLFYCAKAAKSDRNSGLDEFSETQYSHDGRNKPIENPYQRNQSVAANSHPTVKPVKLMQWLAKLITPPNGLILDPFTGSGSTGKAAILEGFRFIGIEKEPEYHAIAAARIHEAEQQVKRKNAQQVMEF